jgi:hypothetical protein
MVFSELARRESEWHGLSAGTADLPL